MQKKVKQNYEIIDTKEVYSNYRHFCGFFERGFDVASAAKNSFYHVIIEWNSIEL